MRSCAAKYFVNYNPLGMAPVIVIITSWLARALVWVHHTHTDDSAPFLGCSHALKNSDSELQNLSTLGHVVNHKDSKPKSHKIHGTVWYLLMWYLLIWISLKWICVVDFQLQELVTCKTERKFLYVSMNEDGKVTSIKVGGVAQHCSVDLSYFCFHIKCEWRLKRNK